MRTTGCHASAYTGELPVPWDFSVVRTPQSLAIQLHSFYRSRLQAGPPSREQPTGFSGCVHNVPPGWIK